MDNQELKKILNNNAPADFDLEGVFGLMLACANLIEQNARLREALQIYADDAVIGTVARKALKGKE